jgi:AcrR family transcriptional regulator
MPSESAARIYEVATRLFGDRSYPSTSMRDISEAVGILPGSLYAHISSKETLLREIVTSGIDKYLEAVGPIVTRGEPAAARLRAAVRAHVCVAAENAELSQVAFHQWKFLSEPSREVVVAKRAEYEGFFRRIVDDGVKAKEFRIAQPRVAVLGVLGLLNWVPEWFSPSGRLSADEVADALADVVLSGLVGGPAPRSKR